MKNPCLTCGSAKATDAHHVGLRKHYPTLTVSVCRTCHQVLTRWQNEQFYTGYRQPWCPDDPFRALLVGTGHLLALGTGSRKVWATTAQLNIALGGKPDPMRIIYNPLTPRTPTKELIGRTTQCIKMLQPISGLQAMANLAILVCVGRHLLAATSSS